MKKINYDDLFYFCLEKNIEIKIENITIFNWKCAIKDVWLSADKLQIFLISLITILRKKELEFSLTQLDRHTYM